MQWSINWRTQPKRLCSILSNTSCMDCNGEHESFASETDLAVLNTAEVTYLSEATKSVATCNSLRNLRTLAAKYLHCAAATAAANASYLLRFAEQRSKRNSDEAQYWKHGPCGVTTIGHGTFFLNSAILLSTYTLRCLCCMYRSRACTAYGTRIRVTIYVRNYNVTSRDRNKQVGVA